MCTNLETGKAEYIRITDMLNQVDVMRASASMPYVSRIVDWEGRKLLDGGCTDSIPVSQFQRMGYKRNVVVLTREEGFVKEPEMVKLAEIYYHRYPRFVDALKNRHKVYNQTLADIRAMEKTGEAFVIRPSRRLTVGRMESDLEKIQEVYELGKKDAKRNLSALKAWMQQEGQI